MDYCIPCSRTLNGTVTCPECGGRGETWSKLYNEAIMNLVRRHPTRFIGIASVPLQDPPARHEYWSTRLAT